MCIILQLVLYICNSIFFFIYTCILHSPIKLAKFKAFKMISNSIDHLNWKENPLLFIIRISVCNDECLKDYL